MEGSKTDTPLIFAVKNRDMTKLSSLIEIGENVDQAGVRGWTPLMHASHLGYVEIVLKLIKSGVSLDARSDHEWETSVMLASCFLSDAKERNFLYDSEAASVCLKILNNKTKILKMLLEAGANPNSRNADGESALIQLTTSKLWQLYSDSADAVGSETDARMSTAYQILVERCRLLLQYNANVRIKDNNGMTALMHAAKNKLPKCLEVLISNFSPVNDIDSEGKTALMYAAHTSTKCCAILLRHGADINQQDNQGQTALMHAASKRKCFRFLLKNGADINLRNREGSTALMKVVAPSCFLHPPDYQLLREKNVDVNQENDNGDTALLLAVCRGPCLECCQLLIRLGAKLNVTQRKDGPMAMMRALDLHLPYHGRDDDFYKCCQLLIGPERAVNDEDVKKKVEVMHYIINDDSGSLELLLDEGVDVSFQYRDGMTPLMIAFKCRAEDCSNILQYEEQDLDLQDNDGKTALMYAVENLRFYRDVQRAFDIKLHFQMTWKASHCETLLNRGASVNVADKHGCTALMYLVSSLANFPYNEPCHDCQDTDDTYFCERLIEKGADVNQRDKEGRTALIHAIESWSRTYDYYEYWGYTGVDEKGWCHCLINGGANLNIQDYHGRTALMYAIIHNTWDAFEFILQNGADVNIQDNEGNAVKRYACLFESWECTKRLQSYQISSLSACPEKKGTRNSRAGSQSVQTPQNADEHMRANNEGTDGIYYAGHMNQTDSSTVSLPSPFTLLLRDIRIVVGSGGNWINLEHKLLKHASELLQNGENPVLSSEDRLFLYSTTKDQSRHVFDLKQLIQDNLKHLIQVLVCNGVMVIDYEYRAGRHPSGRPVSMAVDIGRVDIARYFIANCYMSDEDLMGMRSVCAAINYSFGNQTVKEFLHQATSQPWPLVKLAFIKVSSTLGFGPERQSKVSQTQLPSRIQSMLNFSEPVSKLAVDKWRDIPLCFDPVQYEHLPKPRPLLYYWPFGQDIMTL